MRLHNIPSHIEELIDNVYQDFRILIATKTFVTKPVIVQKGVLQGDSLSPLLFNMCFNTLITTIKQKSVEGLGYYLANALGPCHWFQFADDSTVTTANEEDYQLLLNFSTKWCTWANLKIRVDKCRTFGIRKTATMACQYKPLLLVNNQRIPPVKLDDETRLRSITSKAENYSNQQICDQQN